MAQDASLAFGLRSDGWAWISGSPSPFLTSFLLLFLLCFLFAVCVLPVQSTLDRLGGEEEEKRYIGGILVRMTLVIALLAVGSMLVGQFFGFSIILGLSVVISLLSLFWKPKRPHSKTQGA